MFQGHALFPHLSCFDNIAFGLRMRGRPKRDIPDAVRTALDTVRLKGYDDRYPDSLSGGQQQRVALARACALEPRVLLFDEPTSALDPIATANIEELVADLKRKVAILIVTHNMQQAARVAEMTAFFSLKVEENGSRHGILVEYDSTEKIYNAWVLGCPVPRSGTLTDWLLKDEARNVVSVVPARTAGALRFRSPHPRTTRAPPAGRAACSQTAVLHPRARRHRCESASPPAHTSHRQC